MFLSEWREFPSAPCLARGMGGGGVCLMAVRLSMLLKSHASVTCFRACFLPDRAKDLSASRSITRKKCGVFSIRVRPTFTNLYALNG